MAKKRYALSFLAVILIIFQLPQIGYAGKNDPPSLDVWLSSTTPTKSVTIFANASAEARDEMDANGYWKDNLGHWGTFFIDQGIVTTVTTNCIVTVEVSDNGGRTTIQSIAITNIDLSPPQITLVPNSTSLPVDVKVNANDNGGSGVSLVKWASGAQTKSYFINGGTVLTGNTFSVTANGTYTVYAKDAVGNDAVQTINISALAENTYNYHYLSNGEISYIETPRGVITYVYDNNGNLVSKSISQ